jgi:hypothetical protein
MVQITYASQDIISDYDLIGLHFMKNLFDMDYREMALSDESWLSDFSGCGLTDDDWIKISQEYLALLNSDINYPQSETLYHKVKNTYWDKIITQKVFDEYRLSIEKTNVLLYALFDAIKGSFSTKKIKDDIASFVFEEPEEIVLKPREPLTFEQIQEHLTTTLNPFFYKTYAHVSFEEAKDLVKKRKENIPGHYKPYIP